MTGEVTVPSVVLFASPEEHLVGEGARRQARLARLDGRLGLAKETAQGTHETVLVYDLGGGTFDATVIELADRRITVLAVEGDHQLGGADWDERLALHLSRRFCAEHPDAEDP